MRSFFQWSLYPLTICASVLIFFVLYGVDEKHLVATYLPFLFTIVVIVLAEKGMPYDPNWKPNGTDLKNDGLYFLIVQAVLPFFLVYFATIFISRYVIAHNMVIRNIWPHDQPLLVQELMVVLISDLLRYWLHRFNHTIPLLWRLHAVHHSSTKIYWFNSARFHPAEKAMQFMLDMFPFMLLGVSEELIGLHIVLYAVNGFFQHSNIDLKFGWLNYLVSSNELHRWHHSRKTEESNRNYGNNVSVWDILFGTYYDPKGKRVEELGLINRNYPMGIVSQTKAPLVYKWDKIDLPELSLWHNTLNFLLRMKLGTTKRNLYREFVEGTKDCEQIQLDLLLKMVEKNKNTAFGKEYHFDKIRSYADFKKNVPLGNYDTLFPYIEKQSTDAKNKALISDEILMFNRTSGTTAVPKLIPVTDDTLKGLKESQDLMVYLQYKVQPYAYHGKIVGIASPAIEGMSDFNIPIGSASGHFYKNVSKVVASKYVIPYEVLEIEEYELKYYVMLLFCLQHKDITYIATANPTTLLKLAEILKRRRAELLKDMQTGTITGLNANSYRNFEAILKKFKPGSKRVKELVQLLAPGAHPTFEKLWPYLKLIATWTGGSCGIALQKVLTLMPKDVSVIDLGYLSSEVRGTVTFDAETQSGLCTYTNNFFEFAERLAFENGTFDFLLLHQLEKDKEYYIFITTPAGLYRYNMNDVIRVSGFLNKCPLIKFIQKGKGVCNITGEKLYESQVLNAMAKLSVDGVFIQVLANEKNAQYEFFIETGDERDMDTNSFAVQLDDLLCEQNYEYKEKRKSNRLKPISVSVLKPGTFENVKKIAISNGQSEGQYKTMLLQYKDQLSYDLDQFVK